MTDKRYYWLKLKEEFFGEDEIEWLEEQENGKDYVLFYLKLCLKSLKTNGCLIRKVGQMLIPYDAKKLAEITKTDYDTVSVAMVLLRQVGLVEVLDTGEIFLAKLNDMVGSETHKASQMRKLRDKRKSEEDEQGNNVTTMLPEQSNNVTTMLEQKEKNVGSRDRERDRDRERYRDRDRDRERVSERENFVSAETKNPPQKTKPVKHKHGEYQNVLLSDNELEKLKAEYPDYQERIERLSGYIASKGTAYKSHYATIRNWARKEQVQIPQVQQTQPQSEFDRFMSQLQEIYDSEE